MLCIALIKMYCGLKFNLEREKKVVAVWFGVFFYYSGTKRQLFRKYLQMYGDSLHLPPAEKGHFCFLVSFNQQLLSHLQSLSF